jgi:hypothetical protein
MCLSDFVREDLSTHGAAFLFRHRARLFGVTRRVTEQLDPHSRAICTGGASIKIPDDLQQGLERRYIGLWSNSTSLPIVQNSCRKSGSRSFHPAPRLAHTHTQAKRGASVD